jgi:taurine dioxygenase
MTEISYKPLVPFGIEVQLDLSVPLSEAMQKALQNLRGAHHLLLFRKQRLSLPQQIEAMRAFGPVLLSQGDGVGYVSNVRKDGILGDSELEFHSDLDFSPRGAYHALSLHAVEVDDDVTATQFASSARAYHRLPDDLRALVHSHQALDVQLKDITGRNRVATVDKDTPRLIHPMVRQLPFSGNLGLWASISGTDSIVGLSEKESDTLLGRIFATLYDPTELYEHRWRTGDILIWDNQALQHRRAAIPPGVKRTLQRVAGADPGSGFFDVFPQFKYSQYATTEAQDSR